MTRETPTWRPLGKSNACVCMKNRLNVVPMRVFLSVFPPRVKCNISYRICDVREREREEGEETE